MIFDIIDISNLYFKPCTELDKFAVHDEIENEENTSYDNVLIEVIEPVTNHACVTSCSNENVKVIEAFHNYACVTSCSNENAKLVEAFHNYACVASSSIQPIKHVYATSSTINVIQEHEYAKTKVYSWKKPTTSSKVNKILRRQTGPRSSFVHSPLLDHQYAAGLNTTGMLDYNSTVKNISALCSTTSNDTITDSEVEMLSAAINTKSSYSVARAAVDIVRKQITAIISNNFSETIAHQNKRIHGNVSTLMKKSFLDLKSFEWNEIINEMTSLYPELVQILTTIMLKPEQ